MKTVLVSSLFFLFSSIAVAQEKPSPEAEAFFYKAMAQINTRHVAWIRSTAKEVNEKKLPEADVLKKATQYDKLGKLNNGDIEAIAFLVLMQAAKSAQEDLKAIMAKVKSINKQKQELRDMQAKLKQQEAMTAIQLDSFKLLSSKTAAIQKGQDPDKLKLARSASSRRKPSKAQMDTKVEKVKNDLDSMSEMGEELQLKTQMTMEAQSKMISTISNLLKKISDTQNSIIQNLK
jgi:hypothetical protein